MLTNNNFKNSYEIPLIEGKKVNWTATTLSEYLFCPYQLYLKRFSKKYKVVRGQNSSVELGTIFHKLIELVYKLNGFSTESIRNIVNFLFQDEVTRKELEKYGIERAVDLLFDIYYFLESNFTVRRVEPEIFLDFEQKNYTLKVAPDIVCDECIIELKTTVVNGISNGSYLPYKYKVQASIYETYLKKKPLLVIVNLEKGEISTRSLETIKDFRDKVEISTTQLLKRNYDPISTVFPDRCARCFVKDICDRKSMMEGEKNGEGSKN